LRQTILPVIGVPMPTTSLNGIDSLLSIVQMPKGIPVATMAIGKEARGTRLVRRRDNRVERRCIGERLQSWRGARAKECSRRITVNSGRTRARAKDEASSFAMRRRYNLVLVAWTLAFIELGACSASSAEIRRAGKLTVPRNVALVDSRPIPGGLRLTRI